MIDTFSSLYLSTGGISLKDVGVDPTRALCSSRETKLGSAVMGFNAGILDDCQPPGVK